MNVKKSFAYFFLILFVGLSFQQASLFGVYLLNEEYITAQFCINKDKPELKCNGKCHMAEVMALQNEANENLKFAQNLIIPVYYSTYTLELPPALLRKYKSGMKETVLLTIYESEHFQPPRV